MDEMKGFYFSLDAMTASMVLIAAVGMLATYAPAKQPAREPFQLDYLHTASLQPVSEWNSSVKSSRTVLSYIYTRYYSGNATEAAEVCEDYFNFSGSYALYFTNSTSRDRACGSLTVNSGGLATEQVPVPDQKVNGSFIGPRSAVMVVKY